MRFKSARGAAIREEKKGDKTSAGDIGGSAS